MTVNHQPTLKLSRTFTVNAITFARMPLVFAWVAFAVVHQLDGSKGFVLPVLACVAIILSGLTDFWDGRLARKWQVVSPLGKMADPLMDKVFYIVVFPTLLWLSLCQGEPGSGLHSLALLFFTVLYMLRDTWVTFLRSVGAMYGADVAAMWLGKVRTALSFPGAGLIYVYFAFRPLFPHLSPVWQERWLVSCYVVEGVLIALTLWSLVTYTAAYLPYIKKALERR